MPEKIRQTVYGWHTDPTIDEFVGKVPETTLKLKKRWMDMHEKKVMRTQSNAKITERDLGVSCFQRDHEQLSFV